MYSTLSDKLLYRRWFCPNGADLNVNYMNGFDIRTTGGCSDQGLGSVWAQADTITGVKEWLGLGISAVGTGGGGGGGGKSAVLGDWSRCSSSSLCFSGCCTSKYSNGVLKCTPLSPGYNPSANGCVGGRLLEELYNGTSSDNLN